MWRPRRTHHWRDGGRTATRALSLRGERVEVWWRTLAGRKAPEWRSRRSAHRHVVHLRPGRTRRTRNIKTMKNRRARRARRITRPSQRRNECTRWWPNHHSRTWAHTRLGRARTHPRVHGWRTSDHAWSYHASHYPSHRRQRLYAIMQARISGR